MTKTLFRLGYVAMSVNLKNSSPSQTITYKRFSQFADEEAAIQKLETVAKSNIQNCLRLLKHNKANDIHFFRLSSRLIPLATHDALKGWDYISPIKEDLEELGEFAAKHEIRMDFHPDHFVVLNTTKKEVMKTSVKTLDYHHKLLTHMKLKPIHRCVLHLGGKYENKESSLERFISNWALVPARIQEMIMLENDDKTYTLHDILYVCEKLNIPAVFDLHHHMANHEREDWISEWGRVIQTWSASPLPVKMHISSPKSDKQFRAHANMIDPEMFLTFVKKVNGSTPQIDCMIEAKQKDQALFQLVDDLKANSEVEMVDEASFYLKS
ncbi:UV DNA damage repair endonuclease UvsE [Salinibacillus xinjiangensis]|uniref:UV DNA damage repair endonuclease UvsE n=1 Tax=Salinibacillus xinjiangensis TaxID=1229268 RepID=A0A6G1X4L5_9BACI|nr:UV DNA damage repair endonuclease UvsE [Salinibacillus xinjiangensis]MRG85820.1 UV DNA damage repair endonuclease UvsE [Salinibacillus xinjiangensis]